MEITALNPPIFYFGSNGFDVFFQSEGMMNSHLLKIPFLTVLLLPSLSFAQPCADYACDSGVVRAILDSNQLTAIPVDSVTRTDGAGRINVFRYVPFGTDPLTTLPGIIGNLTALTTLDLHANQISVIPEAVGNLANLTTLDLHNNLISAIPDVIGNLTNLEEIYLQVNRLSAIPDAIGNLANLAWLILSNNHISLIPDALGNLTRLHVLSLHENQISAIPDTLGNLTNFLKAGNTSSIKKGILLK
jgi:Leucine-rich repeat (LRR) protein